MMTIELELKAVQVKLRQSLPPVAKGGELLDLELRVVLLVPDGREHQVHYRVLLPVPATKPTLVQS